MGMSGAEFAEAVRKNNEKTRAELAALDRKREEAKIMQRCNLKEIEKAAAAARRRR